jgi:hypothetical protein
MWLTFRELLLLVLFVLTYYFGFKILGMNTFAIPQHQQRLYKMHLELPHMSADPEEKSHKLPPKKKTTEKNRDAV